MSVEPIRTSGRRARSRSPLSVVLLLSSLALPIASHAFTLAVFSDINSMNINDASRNQLLTNLLGTGTNVLLSDQNAASFDNTSLQAFYSGLGGVTSVSTSAELTTGSLTGIDLLFLNVGCCAASAPQPYSAAESAVISAFLAGGGTVGIIAEPCCGTDANVGGMNAFMASLGSSMSFSLTHFNGGTMTILPTFLGAGVSPYSVGTYNEILGGTPTVLMSGRAVVAFEVIPEPATAGLLVVGLAGLAVRQRRARA